MPGERLRRNVAAAMTLVFCSWHSMVGEQHPKIGDDTPCDPDSGERVLISASQVAESCQVTVGEIAFTVARDHGGRVVYVAVADTRFETPDGIRVGSALADVQEAGAAALQKEPGWAFHTLLPSGWRAAFTTGPSLTDDAPNQETKVRWLFRRK